MFYTLMQRYMMQQLEQLQTLQAQQSQFITWQFQQFQAWQSLMLKSLLGNQLMWLPNSPYTKTGFAPFTLPFMQYYMQINRLTVPVRQPTPYTQADVTQAPRDVTPKTSPSTVPSASVSLTNKPTKPEKTPESVIPTDTPQKDKPLVPPELTHQVPEPHDEIPPQVDFPQPTDGDNTTTQVATKQVATKPAQAKPTQNPLTIAKTVAQKTQQTNTPTPKPTQTKTDSASKTGTNKTPNKKNATTTNALAEVKKTLLQLQAENTDLPLGATLPKLSEPTLEMMQSTDSGDLPPIKPVSSLEQVLHPVDVIDLNTATEAELVRLDGINSRRALDIIAYREKVAPFATIDELVHVKGIGQSIVDKNRTLMKVSHAKSATSQSTKEATNAKTNHPIAPTKK